MRRRGRPRRGGGRGGGLWGRGGGPQRGVGSGVGPQRGVGSGVGPQRGVGRGFWPQRCAGRERGLQRGAGRWRRFHRGVGRGEEAQRGAGAEGASQRAEVAEGASQRAEVAEGATQRAEGAEGATQRAEGTEGATQRAEGTEGATQRAEGTEGASERAGAAEGASERAEAAEGAAKRGAGEEKGSQRRAAGEGGSRLGRVAPTAQPRCQLKIERPPLLSETSPAMERKRTICPCLPPGWKKEEVIRKSGLSAGKSDVYYYSPSGKKFRSKPQLARYLGNSIDLSSFDFRTGKMMPNKLQRNKQRLRNEVINQAKGKLDLNTSLPIRQTASIFKQPVTKVTDHPNNKVKTEMQKVIEQPRQLFWEKRLQGLSACDIAEQIIKSVELPKGLQGIGPGNTNEALLSAIASALHTSSGPITGQPSTAVEKNPAVWLNVYQPMCRAFVVTDKDIRKQEERVQQVRKRLEEALMADELARAEEVAEEGCVGHEQHDAQM
ncbi:methyl-CpG-binding domain protein 3-like isoform X3 [Hemitrygon akajei]|uniref:methyl-CpG-binding domain protein 3-like isoform X2 n=1 Tax=Hemitrygon akajei TaxID=2704970 RepID=UPI003BF9CF33